ncbi:hypothetical protein ACFSMW_06720 [Virgibacillus halophilus]|uniref:Uncharacterized protein n=1 Tax=Tigheibacillus halophilus TaxID=361280 RepID=A0ABU5C7A6_9BACI|nr:hypothetical protein [Virgibacillus halophilus]
MIKTLYKRIEGQTLVIVGELSNQEIKDLKQAGYRFEEPNVNKHGIRVEV